MSARTVSLTRTSPALALGADPGGDVDRRPDVAVGRLDRLAGVDPDPDRDRRSASPSSSMASAARDDRETALDGGADGREDDVEAVALGLDLGAVAPRDRGAHERPVADEQVGRSAAPCDST